MPFRAVVFDMGDIFFDATIWRRALTAHLRALGTPIEYRDLCEKWDAKLVPVYLGRRAYWDAFEGFLSELGLNREAIDRTVTFAREKAREVEKRTLFAGVAETLTQLKQRGLKLAVLSDTESHEARVRQRLADLGIEQYFDAVVTSVDIGHVKPEPEAYAAVLERLGVAGDAAVFVGHDEDELQGAIDFGMTAAAYNCGKQEVPAHHRIREFSELIPLVT